MAFQKSYVVPTTGAVADYWRIVGIETLHTAGAVNVWLCGYVDEAARRAGREPLTTRFFRLPLAAIPGATDLHGVTTAQLYAAVAAAVNTAPVLPVTSSARAAAITGAQATTVAEGEPGPPDPLAGAVSA